MKGQPHLGHVTYYEQLGVPANASQTEIREAFRALARMLHPDQQTDPHLKAVAEQQMRKLNPIYTILSDPERRRRYDDELEDRFAAPIILEGPPPLKQRRNFTRLVWLIAIAGAGGMLYWLASSGISNPFTGGETDPHPPVLANLPIIRPSAPGPNRDSEAAELAQLRSQVKTLTAERDFAMREVIHLRLVTTSHTGTALPEAAPSAMAPAAASAPAPAPPPPGKPTFAGVWLSRSQNAQDYVETTITDRNGVLTGKYHARAQEVVFTFSGSPNGQTLTCPWTGPGGAKGEVSLRLNSDNTVRVDWAVSEAGTQHWPPSGTAVLSRMAYTP